ncbi:MAG: TIM barrel protein [Actinomycetota bacterium]|nr:TIM barrel protein [Actinomycetota bacterium]
MIGGTLAGGKVAGAPISWGVCEVPGWGHQVDPNRVLAEMASLGLTATELGPDGFLPAKPAALRRLLARYRLRLVAGFVPVVLHVPHTWERERSRFEQRCATLAAGGAEVAVLAAATGSAGYDTNTAELDDTAWGHLTAAIEQTAVLAGRYGLATALHPHYGTVIESSAHIARLLATSPVDLCLDTGHVVVGGGDPVDIAAAATGRISHVHLKDVDAAVAARVRTGELTYRQAVIEGMYRPLGAGDLDLAAILTTLDHAGFDGWIVLEQDTVLPAEPEVAAGPIADARTSMDFLQQAMEAA